jgi:hypothetical protein
MKKIVFLLSLAVILFCGNATLYAQGTEKQPTRVPITPAARKQIRNAGLDGDTVIIRLGNTAYATENGECGWSSYGMTLTPYSPSILVPKGVPGDTFLFTILPNIYPPLTYNRQDTINLTVPRPEPPKKYGLHLFIMQTFARDFANRSQINQQRWLSTKVGIETSPWGNPWDMKLWLGFYPRQDFKKSFNLPTVSANPTPEEGWCDCQLEQNTPEFSAGASVSRRIPLMIIGKGEAGLRPELSADFAVSGNPVPGASWALPGAFTLGLPVYWQGHVLSNKKADTGTTAVVFLTSAWQFLAGADPSFELQFGAKISVGTKWFSGKKLFGWAF